MATYSTTATTSWSAEKTFDYLADLRNFAEWDPGVSRVEMVSGEPGGADAVYDVTASGTTLRYRVVEHEAPNRLLVQAKNRFFESTDEIIIEPSGKETRATYRAELELNGPLGLFDPLLGLAFNRIGDRAAAGLEDALDGRRT
ncbi:MAG: hypothetical protein HKN26_10510 [Acidimicrobiales bacterium]|nr:hypothetical protein [Acidimicrobiales bacterium]